MATLVVAAPCLWLAHYSLEQRPATEQAALVEVLAEPPGSPAAVPAQVQGTSTGWRYYVQMFGVEKWRERWALGWGPGSTQWLIAHAGKPELRIPDQTGTTKWMDHLHNTPLEILVQFGVFGATLFAACVAWLVLSADRARRAARMPRDYFLFCMGALAMYLVYSVTDFRLLHPESRALLIMLLGLTFSFSFRPAAP
jgi:O-antigen ligase